MADALDSKSGSLWECGFKSHLRYQFMMTIPLKSNFQRVLFFPEIFEKYSTCDIFCFVIVYNHKNKVTT